MLGILEDNQEEFPILTQKLIIPQHKIQECIAKYHNTKIEEYLGIGKMLRKVRQNCQFPKIKKEVTEYIQKCDHCKRAKRMNPQQIETVNIPRL